MDALKSRVFQSPDILPHLLDLLYLDEILVISQVSRLLYDITQTYIKGRLRAAVCPWIGHFHEFRNILRAVQAVVGGGVALDVCVRSSETPGDLNIFVPRQGSDDMIGFLKDTEGYKERE